MNRSANINDASSARLHAFKPFYTREDYIVQDSRVLEGKAFFDQHQSICIPLRLKSDKSDSSTDSMNTTATIISAKPNQQ
jgi:hypothetical protein